MFRRVAITLPLCSLAISLWVAPHPASAEITAKADVPAQVASDQQILKHRLQTVKRDLDAYRSFAENFRKEGETKALSQLRKPVEEYLAQHADRLLGLEASEPSLETMRLRGEILFIKARLLTHLGLTEAAVATVTEMKKGFGSSRKISIDFSDKTTTLEEAVGIVEAELAKAEKK